MRKTKIVLLWFAFGASATVCAQTAARGQIMPIMVNLGQSPLALVSITSDQNDTLQAVTVRNVSNREIREFKLGLFSGVPAACGGQPASFSEREFGWELISDLKPGSVHTSNNFRVPHQVAPLTATIVPQLAVVAVRFSDGGTWFASRQHESPFDAAGFERQGELLCSISPAAVKARYATAT